MIWHLLGWGSVLSMFRVGGLCGFASRGLSLLYLLLFRASPRKILPESYGTHVPGGRSLVPYIDIRLT